MTTTITAKPLPNNRQREFTEVPGDLFFFEAGDVAEHRGERGTVCTVDSYTRQLRLEGWERTRFVSWEKCRLIHSASEVQEAANPPADEAHAAPKGKAK